MSRRYHWEDEADLIGDYEDALVHVPDRKKRDIEAYVKWRCREAARIAGNGEMLFRFGIALLVLLGGGAVCGIVGGSVYAQQKLETIEVKKQNELLREECINGIINARETEE